MQEQTEWAELRQATHCTTADRKLYEYSLQASLLFDVPHFENLHLWKKNENESFSNKLK